jgi:hypothetical protein
MDKITADETKQIPRAEWEAWCDTFSSGNRGRVLRLEIVGGESGAETVATATPLVAIDYDPVGQGDDRIVSYGEEAGPSRHVIAAPVALWQGQDENGVIVCLDIDNAGGQKTIITLHRK